MTSFNSKFVPRAHEIIRAVRPFTMLSPETLFFTIESGIKNINENPRGVFVECGVWKGGVGIAILLAQKLLFGRVIQKVYFLDSFEGLPSITGKDGEHAEAFARGEWGAHLENCRVNVDDVTQNILRFGFDRSSFRIVKGWFSSTVPELAAEFIKENTRISTLRIDADWYESTKTCLDHLASLVVDQGLIIVDDYYCFDGCARAVHDFLSQSRRPCRLRTPTEGDGIVFNILPPGQ
jgi:O-methyltransferase